LRDAGCEVIYTGLRRTAREVVAVALDEDVDVIGLSILSGAHVALSKQVLDELDAHGARDQIKVVVGGTIGKADIPVLRDIGVAEVFPVRSPLDQLSPRVRALVHGNVGVEGS
jgi:methylmalonyl-CoA mutase C-terminal domain/subunit